MTNAADQTEMGQGKTQAQEARPLCLENAPMEKEAKPVIAWRAKRLYCKDVLDRLALAGFSMTELESRTRAPRNFDEVHGVLISLAKRIGQSYGVFLSVGRRGDNLVFVDEGGQEIVDPGGIGNPASHIVASTGADIDNGQFLKVFAPRALYAAITVRFNQLDAGLS